MGFLFNFCFVSYVVNLFAPAELPWGLSFDWLKTLFLLFCINFYFFNLIMKSVDYIAYMNLCFKSTWSALENGDKLQRTLTLFLIFSAYLSK